MIELSLWIINRKAGLSWEILTEGTFARGHYGEILTDHVTLIIQSVFFKMIDSCIAGLLNALSS